MSKEHQLRAWRTLSARILKQRPLCEDPFGWHAKTGHWVRSAEVHHVEPVKTAPEKILCAENLLALCADCHAAIHAATTIIRRMAADGVPPARIVAVVASKGADRVDTTALEQTSSVSGIGGVLTFFPSPNTARVNQEKNAHDFEKGVHPLRTPHNE